MLNKLLSLFLAFNFLYLDIARALSVEEIDHELQQITTVELYAKSLLEIANEVMEVENAGKKIESILAKIESIANEAKNVTVRNFSLRKLYRVKKILNIQDPHHKIYRQLKSNFILKCDDFHNCSYMITDLADLVDINPRFVDEIIEEKLRGQIRKVTETVTEDLDPNDVYTDSILQRLLQFQLDSLSITAKYYLTSRTHLNNKGYLPRIIPRDRKVLERKLKAQEEEYFQILELEDFKDKYGNRVVTKEYIKAVQTEKLKLIRKKINRDLEDFNNLELEEEEIDNLADQFFNALQMTHTNNQSMNLYIKRSQYDDFNDFTRTARTELIMGNIDPAVIVFTALRFQNVETLLPSRNSWTGFMDYAITRAPTEQQEALKKYRNAYAGIVKIAEAQMIKKLQAYEIPSYSNFRYSIRSEIVKNEKLLAKKYPRFNSIPYQLHQIEYFQGIMAQNALDYQNADDRGDKEDKEHYSQRLMNSHDQFMDKWLTLTCYGTDQNSWHRSDKKREIRYSKSQYKDMNLWDICRGSEFSGRYPYIKSVHAYTYKKAKKRIWTPFFVEMGIMVLMLPLTVASGGVAGIAAKGVSSAAVKVGTHLAVKHAVNSIGKYTLTKLGPKLISCIAGSIVFTAVQRVSLSIFTLNKIKLYEKDKSLWDNYGEELIFGSAIFFFLPYTAGFAQRLAKKNVATHPGMTPFQTGLSTVGIQAGMDTAVFTSVTYIDRSIKKFLMGSDDPILRGWGDFFENLGHSAAISLAFRVKIGARRH